MDMNQLTKITLAWELYGQGIAKVHIAKQLNLHRETVHLWIAGIKCHSGGLLGFLKAYENAKKGERRKRKLDGLLKARIYRLREENRNCCGQKITKYLLDDYGIYLSPKTIYKVLGEKYQLRSKWKKNQVRGPVPKADNPREVIQMDSVDFGEIFAFTAVDIFAKDVSVKLYPSLTAKEGLNFLIYSFASKFNHTRLLQTDGGPEFKAEFRTHAHKYADRLRVSRPYKKNEQAYIESFNRSLRKECLGWSNYSKKDLPDLNRELDDYMVYYHTKRPHMSLDMKTPEQFLKEYQVSDI